jgi:hypothetical protein
MRARWTRGNFKPKTKTKCLARVFMFVFDMGFVGTKLVRGM